MDYQVVGVHYWNHEPAGDEHCPVRAYRESGVFEENAGGGRIVARDPLLGLDRRSADPIANLGALNGEIAAAVADGLRAARRAVIVGGNCVHFPGVIGGLQDVYGPAARIGLVWFDAHGDFNTPRTTLSGMLGGMPVAVAAGLCYPVWREGAHIAAPLPTDRIVMVDVRNLDPAEEQLIRATDVQIARVADNFSGDAPLAEAVARLAAGCDHLYLHVDADVLDATLAPNHHTCEPGGPGIAETLDAIGTVLDTGKVAAFGLTSVRLTGDGAAVTRESALALLRGGLARWRS